jgi:hypothetical protein
VDGESCIQRSFVTGYAWVRHVAHVEEKINPCRDFTRKSEVGRQLGRLRGRWKNQNGCRGNRMGRRGVDCLDEHRK